MKMDPATLKTVRATPLFSKLTDDEAGCLEMGEVIEAAAGTVLASEGEKPGFFHVLLEGELRATRNYQRQSILLGTIKPGGFSGEMMLLLDSPWQATLRASKPSRLFQLHEEGFWRMMTTCSAVAREIFRVASSRMRNLEGYSQQREKLASLGTMAAGLAHELNNPAAAARRAAGRMQQTTDKVQSTLCGLSRTLESEHWRRLLDASQEAESRTAPPMDHLTRSDLMEALGAWLTGRGVASAWELAPTFVDAGIDAAWLEALTAALPAESRAIAVGWLEARLSLKALAEQVEQSTGRMLELVKAIKSYSYMDQAPMQEIDIHEGIESTLTMLGHKLKNVKVERAFDRSAPRIMAYGSELNQVWTNLIDNAIAAVNGEGKVCVGTSVEDNQLVVEIMDNGPGISPEAQAHLFEPFFTTKAVGSGSGLGLVISNRIVGDRHGGEIEFESVSGRTVFKVRLPIRHAPTKPTSP